MGRRSVHTPDELRDLILKAATELIEQGGLSSLSAREIAKAIGYSPGTLYNVFENLDDVVLTIEARLLDKLTARLEEAAQGCAANDRVSRLAQAYLRFTHENPKLWNLLFEHHLPADRKVPAWYQVKLDGLLAQLEEALAAHLEGFPAAEIKHAARVLWGGVHGITSLSTADKLTTITTQSAGPLIDDLLRNYLAGLAMRRAAT